MDERVRCTPTSFAASEDERTCVAMSQDVSKCRCSEGYAPKMLNTSDITCEDVDECALPGTCPANVTCVNTEGSYMCGTCRVGFYGDPAVGCYVPPCDSMLMLELFADVSTTVVQEWLASKSPEVIPSGWTAVDINVTSLHKASADGGLTNVIRATLSLMNTSSGQYASVSAAADSVSMQALRTLCACRACINTCVDTTIVPTSSPTGSESQHASSASSSLAVIISVTCAIVTLMSIGLFLWQRQRTQPRVAAADEVHDLSFNINPLYSGGAAGQFAVKQSAFEQSQQGGAPSAVYSTVGGPDVPCVLGSPPAYSPMPQVHAPPGFVSGAPNRADIERVLVGMPEGTYAVRVRSSAFAVAVVIQKEEHEQKGGQQGSRMGHGDGLMTRHLELGIRDDGNGWMLASVDVPHSMGLMTIDDVIGHLHTMREWTRRTLGCELRQPYTETSCA